VRPLILHRPQEDVMAKPFKGTINLDGRDSVPDWEPFLQPVAPEGAPNVLYIVLDDVGFSAMEPWGGLIETPNINRLAARGLTYTNWHTTALCSPTRSSLLTGRNHTTNGMACIAEATSGHGLRGLQGGRVRTAEADGHLPADAALTPLNPYAGEASADGKPWPPLDVVCPWDSLSEHEKRLFCRMAEVYAGFLSHTDHEIGRLLDFLDQSDQLDNTIVVLVSDNGASGEGGPNGSVNESLFFNGIPDDVEQNLRFLDELGSPATYNHYPVGGAWAFNTPFKMWKRYNFEGGVADPLVISWPP
jgi:arylsulfatase A-like enzyme